MGYIRIETVVNQNKKISFEIESNGLYSINIAGLPINTLDRISEICIVEDILIIRTEDRDFRNGTLFAPFIKNERKKNNIYAFNWHSDFLWNIADIVGDIKMSFSSISHISKEKAESEFEVTIPEGTSILFRAIAGGFTFIIDVVNKNLLYKIPGKVR
ncbi:hypothetical protein LJB90_02605 [Eubacteriales bacterium OttesenSCG-928-G02]|nr:hypothetical protein [Eubacteriales bacterium OttesenSCG-928-G02]